MPAVKKRRAQARAARRRSRAPWNTIKLRAWWRAARHSAGWRDGGAVAVASVAVGAVALALAPSGGFSALGGRIGNGFVHMTANLGLRVERVTVRGRLHTDPRKILDSVGVHRGDPILGVNPDTVRRRLEALDWVAEAKVERLLPDAVHIEITERRPFALWQRDRRLTLIDRNGVPISDQAVPEAADLPLVVGDGAADHAASLMAMLSSEPKLYQRVRAAVWVGERRWNLRLDNGIDIRLPEQDPDIAWRRLARLEQEHRLLERQVQAVDLRIPDRLIVQLTAETADRRRNPGEDT
jgi:cell division protein FtsQ